LRLYGSSFKENYRKDSGIDPTNKDDKILFAEFKQIDDLMLPYTVDLSQYNQLEKINRVGITIYT